MKVLFLGGGYCSEFIIPLLPEGSKIYSTHTKLPYIEEFKNFKNVKRLIYKDLFAEKIELLSKFTHILISIPPNENGDISFHEIEKQKTKMKNLKWLGYFSTTGVYGDHNGKWVSEKSNCKPTNSRAKNRIKAEKQYIALHRKINIPSHIFRLPGIYGPNRSIFDRIEQKKIKNIKKKNHFFSRVHVEDIAKCIFESMKHPTPGEIFNIVDDYPSNAEEVLLFACKLMNIQMPESIKFNDDTIPEMTRSFYFDNKRVSNKKVKNFFGYKFKYPSFKSGLLSIFDNKYKIK